MNKNATNYRICEGARIQKKHGPQSIENAKYKTKTIPKGRNDILNIKKLVIVVTKPAADLFKPE